MHKGIVETLSWFATEQAINLSTKSGAWKLTVPLAEKVAKTLFVKSADPIKYGPLREREDKICIASNLVRSAFKAYEQGSPNVRKRLMDTLLSNLTAPYYSRPEVVSFKKEHGICPPGFLTISPFGGCNLKCKGCYASSSPSVLPSLSAKTFQWVIDQKRTQWGSWFTVVSGGEPLLWRDNDVDLIEIAARNPDQYFLVYTNGTLIDERTAERLAEVGNITLAISVEGFEKETDYRRGKGTFKRILKAFENLRNNGVPFGISTTAVPENAELLISDEMIDFFFNEQGALYQWLFQYMPIGRGIDTKNQVSPEVRRRMWIREQEIIYERHLFLADFWNGGPFSSGCIAGGREGGYLYIDWNGNIYPCVFVPYWKDNIHDLISAERPLSDAVFSDLFTGVRDWQLSYNYKKSPHERGNEIRPCLIRDHHEKARELVTKTAAVPAGAPAAEALQDNDYIQAMKKYDLEIASKLDPIWEEHYRDA